jgi:hypothetical protein
MKMRSRALILVPLAFAALFGIAYPLVAPADRDAFFLFEIMLAKVLALCGCVAAADRFEPGDRTRTIWNLFVLDFALLIGKDLVQSPVLPVARLLGPTLSMGLRAAFMLGANVAGTAAWIILARTWRVAGLTLAGSMVARSAVLTAAIAAALALVGWGTSRDLFALIGGRHEAALNVISDVADVIGFSLVAPVALTAWTLRGGTLFWPYLYLTACTFVWMLFDMTESLGAPLGLDAGTRRAVEELFRCMACGLHFAAGMAQRWSIRGVATRR